MPRKKKIEEPPKEKVVVEEKPRKKKIEEPPKEEVVVEEKPKQKKLSEITEWETEPCFIEMEECFKYLEEQNEKERNGRKTKK